MRILALTCVLALSPTDVSAQPDIFGPQRSAWGPRLDTIGVSAASRTLWRGYDLGLGVHAGAAVGIWGRSVTSSGAWHISVAGDGFAVDARSAGGSRADAALEVGRLLGAAEAVASAWGGAYWVDVPGDDLGAEFGVRIDDIPIPFVPEVWPTVHVRASRATGPLEGTFLGALIRQEVGIQQYAVRFEIGADTDNAARTDFAAPRWRAEVGIAKGIGQWMARAEGGAVRHAGATLGWTGAGLSWRF
jgi:hypothetical protein